MMDREVEAPTLTLFFSYCKQITNALLGRLPRSLRKLYMSWCVQLTDEGLSGLPPQLHTLSLIGCHRVRKVDTEVDLRYNIFCR